MKKAMTITYEVDGALYINLTNRCSNRCEFCIRNNGDGAYGSDSLWLEREPSVNEALESIFERDLGKYTELVFCGYGEPSYRLEECREIALAVKRKYPDVKIRMNTNGHSSAIHGYDTAPLYKDAFDSVSVSLNSSTAQGYQAICHSVFGESIFEELLDFTAKVNNYVDRVILSVVRETLTEEQLSECERIADGCGVALKVRAYIPPEHLPDSEK